jgi:hypothetical protein
LLHLPLAVAQDPGSLPSDIRQFIDEARALPPEFSADILLRLSNSSAIGDTASKRQLIEEAFRAAAGAQLPYRRVGAEQTDARASRAYWDNGLESLTLQTRAVEAMIVLDPQRARALFDAIPNPEVPALSCQVTGAPILSAYYQTAATLLERAFTAEQRAKLEHIQFLKDVIGRMRSPVQVTPTVKLIYTSAVSSDERRELVTAFSNMLPVIQGTPRVFGAAMLQMLPVSAPVRLPAGVNPARPMLEAAPGQLPASVVETAPQLVPAMRSFILKHVSGPRCSEDFRQGQPPRVVNDFNYLVSILDPGSSMYKPISVDDLKAASDAGTYDRYVWWASDRSKRVIAALQWLNHGNRNLPGEARFFTEEERKTEEWNAHFVDTLRLIEGWNEIEESSADDWFGMVSESYELLAAKAPPGTQRAAVMARYLNFMETQYPRIASRNLWFTQLKSQWRSKDAWIVEQLVKSSNPVMSLYARVNRRIAQ